MATKARTGTRIESDSWSNLHCRLFWVYDAPPRKTHRRCKYITWPAAGWLIKKGCVELEGVDGKVAAMAGQWIFPSNRCRWQNFSDDADIFSIRFAIQWRSGQSLFPLDETYILEARRYPKLRAASKRLIKAVQPRLQGKAPTAKLTPRSIDTHFDIVRVFYDWAHLYVRIIAALDVPAKASTEVDPRIMAAHYRLIDMPYTERWTEKSLAEECGLSVSQLNRLCHRYYGTTPLEVFRNRRYADARDQLRVYSRDIKAIAYDLGFSSPANFSTWFKKRSGHTPKAWRELKKHDTMADAPADGF